MKEFEYYNIFESKGAEYLITIVFFTLLVPFWLILRWAIRKPAPREAGYAITEDRLLVPKGILFSKNHSWAYMARNGDAIVGMDDLVQHLTGDLKVNLLKEKGDEIKKGDLMGILEADGRNLSVFAPVSGKIDGVNHEVMEKEGLYNRDPYGDGWFYRIEPSAWRKETASYYLADESVSWINKELGRIRDFLSETVSRSSSGGEGLVLQEGGYPSESALRSIPEDGWKDFQREFLENMA